MKGELVLLMAVVMAILIVLLDAYALSGPDNPAPVATPTVQPAATPTPTPAPASTAPIDSVTAPSPSPAETAMAGPMPCPTASNGTQRSKYGYWTTYPQLYEEPWSGPNQ